MKQNNIIELKNYRTPETFDFAAYNKRAKAHYRNSEIRAWISQLVDTTVTAAIGICTVFCVYLSFTML